MVFHNMAGSSTWSARLIIILSAFFVGSSLQQAQDPLADFCRRFGHQTCIIDDRLYIDGGLVNFNPITENAQNYSNPNLLYTDFTVINNNFPQEYNNLSKPDNVPSVSGGHLWPDTINKFFYLYGGEYQATSSIPSTFSLWRYDVIYNNWTAMPQDTSQSRIGASAWGAGLTLQQRALGFWYGGWISNMTTPGWGDTPYLTSNLVMYNMVTNTWTNSSGPDTIGRAEGVLLYIPASDAGMLVYLGGIQSNGTPGEWIAQDMGTILLFDIASSRWYTQTTTGTAPGNRRRFCAGAAYAKDSSSYNIYLYGGAGMPPDTAGYDDVWILTLPSFQWIKWFPTSNDQTPYPHHSSTCNVVNGNQMIVMGGTFPLSNQSTVCDAPIVYGQHNLDLGQTNSDNALWYAFNYSKKGYSVPAAVISEIGGRASGGATKTKPSAGFSEGDLSVYLTRSFSPASTRTATRAIPSAAYSNPSRNSNTGAIIGGSVAGGIIILALLIVGIWFCLKRKNLSERNGKQHKMESPISELPADNNKIPLQEAPPGVPSWLSSNSTQGYKYSELDGNSYSPCLEPVELAADGTNIPTPFSTSASGIHHPSSATTSPKSEYFRQINSSSPQTSTQPYAPSPVPPEYHQQQQQIIYPPPPPPANHRRNLSSQGSLPSNWDQSQPSPVAQMSQPSPKSPTSYHQSRH